MKRLQLAQGILALLFAAIIWGGVYPVAHSALFALNGYYMALARYGGAAIILLILLFILEGKRSLHFDGKWLLILWYGTAGTAAFGILVFMGVTYSTPLHGAILIALTPLITLLGNWIFHSVKPNPISCLCIIAAFMGVFLIITDGDIYSLFVKHTAFGNLLYFLASLAWVIYSFGSTKVPQWSSLRYTTLSMSLGAVVIVIILIMINLFQHNPPPSLQVLNQIKFPLFYLIILATVLALLFWNTGVKKLGIVNAMLFNNFIPVSTFSIGLFQGEHYSLIEYSGALLTILALAINSWWAHHNAPQA